MVATSMHYIIGIFVAWLFGVRGSRKYWYGLIGVIPDLDGIIVAAMLLFKRFFGVSLAFLEESQAAVTIFAHRGISHSLFLIGVFCLGLYVFKAKKKFVMLFGTSVLLHLFMDYITSWKMFPLLPFSFAPAYLGIVEIFDSVLVVLTTSMLAFFFGMSILERESIVPLIFSFVFVAVFGFTTSLFMREYSVSALIVTALCFMSVFSLFVFLRRTRRRVARLISLSRTSILVLACLMVGYIALLFLSKIGYAVVIGTSPINVEPLEEFGFNFNAHTFEIEQEEFYRIGVISLRGIEEDTFVKIVNDFTGGLDEETIDAYKEAYEKALYVNWFNHPVYSFRRDGEGVVYANIRYAKSFLETEHIPGPRNGLEVTLKDDLLVSYGDGWFS